MKNFIKKKLFYLALPLLICCQHDITTQVTGVYKVHYLQVFDKVVAISQDFVGVITLTKTDASHIILGMDIRPKTDEPTPVETLCTLLPSQKKVKLVETKTNAILGYLQNGEIHLSSEDNKGAKTVIIGKH